jgi:hypothetical protein
MDTALSEWTMENGNIVIRPVTGFTTFVAFDMGVCLRIEFVKSAEWLKTGEREAEQLVLTPDQADQLAEMLKRQAQNARRPPPANTAAN